MLHSPLRPEAPGTWRRIRAALLRRPLLRRANLGGAHIHSSWCTCHSCRLNRGRMLRLDLGVVGFGAVAALLALATILILGID